MKNIGKNRSGVESFSASDAAATLGVSIPTLKRMVSEGSLESFRTPGGHLRIMAASVQTLPGSKRERFHPVRDASPVLQNRRERLEELTLEAQEMRARRELAKLQREEKERVEQEQAKEEVRERDAEERRAEIELEREQLEHASEQERARKETAEAIATFRCQWLEEANQALADARCDWLSAAQKKEIIDAVEVEIDKRKPRDSPRMVTILTRAIAALVERYDAQQTQQKQREHAITSAVSKLPFYATDADEARATIAAREAIRRLETDADESHLRISAEGAVRPIQRAVERGRLKDRLLEWAVQQLPWGKTELDALRVRRECAEILAELPDDFAELEAKEAMGPTVQEAAEEVEQRKARTERQSRRL